MFFFYKYVAIKSLFRPTAAAALILYPLITILSFLSQRCQTLPVPTVIENGIEIDLMQYQISKLNWFTFQAICSV